MSKKQSGSLLSSLSLLIVFAAVILLIADYVLQPDRFPVSRISFIGEFRHVEKSALQENVSPYIGNNFFAIDLQGLELIASWNKTAWVTSDAEIVEIPNLKMRELPRWFGPQGTQVLVQLRYHQFSNLLADVDMKLKQLTYSQRGAWQLIAVNDERKEQVNIRLGRRDMEDRLFRFSRAYGQTLVKLEQRLVSVDLRYPNGFAVKWDSIEEGGPVSTG
jgi:cell division protein FtsQ